MANDFEKDLQIDKNYLHHEWLGQPVLFAKYANMAAEAREAMERAKQKLEVTRSEIDANVRKRPADFGVDKTTENAVASAVIKTELFQSAQEEVNQARLNFNILSNAVTAFEQRKYALENLVRLFLANYWAKPAEPANGAGFEQTAKEEEKQEVAGAVRQRTARRRTE